MMISPEYFYEENLKGKSEREILTVIRDLKREIGRLKKIMEHTDYVQTICPGEDVQISCSRDYLERAKQALAEVGGTYTPSQAELRAEKFNANLPYICRVEFNVNGYFRGYEERTYVIKDDEVITFADTCSSTMPPAEPFDDDEEEMDKETLFDGLARLHIGEWRREYAPTRFDIAIRYSFSWNLNIYFSNGAKPVKIDGHNNYPYNFEQLLELFNVELFTIDDFRGTSDQKTIHEKWGEGGPTILLPKKLTKLKNNGNSKKRIAKAEENSPSDFWSDVARPKWYDRLVGTPYDTVDNSCEYGDGNSFLDDYDE